MADRPIIFSAPMVRALLEGRKTQTRRLINPQPTWEGGGRGFSAGWDWGPLACWPEAKSFAEAMREHVPYAPGDRLWVRETWAPNEAPGDRVIYKADHGDGSGVHVLDLTSGRYEVVVNRWRSPIHMPRWASRLTLAVTEVRVQRLHEISEEDARAEGVTPEWLADEPGEGERGGKTLTALTGYRDLWNSIHGPGAWDLNPWVAAISFTVHRCNIDAMEAA